MSTLRIIISLLCIVSYSNILHTAEHQQKPTVDDIENNRLQKTANQSLKHAFVRSEIIRCGTDDIKKRMQEAIAWNTVGRTKSKWYPNVEIKPYIEIQRTFYADDHGVLAQRVLTRANSMADDIPDFTKNDTSYGRCHASTELEKDVNAVWNENEEADRVLYCFARVDDKELIERLIAEEEQNLY